MNVIAIDETIAAEGGSAFKNGIAHNPYPEISGKGLSWHTGWMDAAGINGPLRIRLTVLTHRAMTERQFEIEQRARERQQNGGTGNW